MANRDLDNIRIEKDIAISMTKEIGLKVANVIKSNFSAEREMDNEKRNIKIIDEIESIEIKEAFELEEER